MRRQLRSRRAPASPYGYRSRLVSPGEQNVLPSLLRGVGWELRRSWLSAASPQHGQEQRGLRKPIISRWGSDSWHPIVP